MNMLANKLANKLGHSAGRVSIPVTKPLSFFVAMVAIAAAMMLTVQTASADVNTVIVIDIPFDETRLIGFISS